MQPVKLASCSRELLIPDKNWFITQKMAAWKTSLFCEGISDSTVLRNKNIVGVYLTPQAPETAIFWGYI